MIRQAFFVVDFQKKHDASLAEHWDLIVQHAALPFEDGPAVRGIGRIRICIVRHTWIKKDDVLVTTTFTCLQCGVRLCQQHADCPKCGDKFN